MSSSKYFKSTFNPDWTDAALHKSFSTWIAEVPDNPFVAHCKLCRKTFSLSNMAKQAVTSHAQSAKHRKLSAALTSPAMFNFISKESSKNEDNASVNAGASTSSVASKPPSVSNFLIQEDALKAEVLWAMQLVASHSSFNAFKDVAELFINMFADTDIAKKCTLGRAKMSYLVCYGLAPYFHLSLQNSVKDKNYVICFDEALNRVSQKCQMDIIVRYWCDSLQQVETRYWNSVFLGRTRAEELFQKFKEAIPGLDINLLLQISMDGPNVNLKFLKHVKEELLSENDCHILDLGTCGLHIVHGAFQFGHKSTCWKVDSVLRALYGLFKDSPSRRANFIEITGTSLFPLKFCAIRWIENVSVCERALDVFKNVKKYVEVTKKDLPGTVTCDIVVNACSDSLILAKISFFSHIASILEPFLKKFQTTKPMIPFLYENIHSFVRQLMTKIVKSNIIEEAETLEKLIAIDLEDAKNLKLRKNVDIGIVTSRQLNLSGSSESQKRDFLTDCFNFVKSTTKKILDRTSKNFAVLRAVSSVNPILMKNNAVLCVKRMATLLELLYCKGKISPACAERAKLQFDLLISKIKNEFNEKFSAFKEDMRLDKFYYDILTTAEFTDIWKVVKLVLVLSHGNAAVESGFSINKDMLVENLKEDSLIGLRTVYDTIQSNGGITKVPITKDLLSYAKSARARYHLALEKQREIQEKDKEKETNKRKISEQIKILQKKKMKLMSEKTMEIADIDVQIRDLSKNVSP